MDIENIIHGLSSQDTDSQDAAAKELAKLKQKGFDTAKGIMLLRAASAEFPSRKQKWQDISAELIRAVAHQPRFEYLDEVLKLFASYNSEAKTEALALVAALPEREAALAYMELLARFGAHGEISRLVTWPLKKEPRFADIFFPGLLDFGAEPSFEWEVYALCLQYFEAGLLEIGSLNSRLSQIISSYLRHSRLLAQAQQPNGVAWMWEDEYQEHRNIGALLLDLLGFFPEAEAIGCLRSALSLNDVRLKHFALISLLKLGQEISSNEIAEVASSSEMRNSLYRKLKELHKADLYPEKYRTQAAFAESDMVNWLSYPTEMGRVPDEIELGKTITVETEDGSLLYYVFRFRTHPPHWAAKDGWLAGVSGPFLETSSPSPDSLGETFSTLEAWDSQTPEGHLGDIQEIIERWREHRRTRGSATSRNTA